MQSFYFVLLPVKTTTEKKNKLEKNPPKAQIAVGSSRKKLHSSLKCENMVHTPCLKHKIQARGNLQNSNIREKFKKDKLNDWSDLQENIPRKKITIKKKRIMVRSRVFRGEHVQTLLRDTV